MREYWSRFILMIMINPLLPGFYLPVAGASRLVGVGDRHWLARPIAIRAAALRQRGSASQPAAV
jgi:hypothetical protein